jgi:hypothetical protein
MFVPIPFPVLDFIPYIQKVSSTIQTFLLPSMLRELSPGTPQEFEFSRFLFPASLKTLLFLGAFAKLLKATNSFVMSVYPPVRLSVCTHGTISSHWTDFDET